MQVRHLVETSPPTDDGSPGEIPWLQFLLPPRDEEPTVLAESGTFPPDAEPFASSLELRRLLDETSDLLESRQASTVLAHMLAVGFELLIDGKLAPLAYLPKGSNIQSYSATGPGTGDDSDASTVRLTELVEDTATAKFASVLAVLARQAHVIGNGQPNDYLAVSDPPSDDLWRVIKLTRRRHSQWRRERSWKASAHWSTRRISSLRHRRLFRSVNGDASIYVCGVFLSR